MTHHVQIDFRIVSIILLGLPAPKCHISTGNLERISTRCSAPDWSKHELNQ